MNVLRRNVVTFNLNNLRAIQINLIAFTKIINNSEGT